LINQRRANVEKFTKKLHKCRNQNIFKSIIFNKEIFFSIFVWRWLCTWTETCSTI